MLGSLALFAPAPASAAPLSIDVRCAQLGVDPELVAALEARTLAELALIAPEGGTLRIDCEEQRARVEWRAAGAPPQRGEYTLPLEPTAAVDVLVAAAWELGRRPVKALPPPEPPVSDAPATTATASAASQRSALRPLAWLGGSVEIWQTGSRGWAGPRGGAGLDTKVGRFGVGGGARFGFEEAAGVGLSTVDALLVWDIELFGPLVFGAGATVSWLRARGAGELEPQARDAVLVALSLQPRLSFGSGPQRLTLGPEFRYYAKRVRVRVNGAERLGVPALSVGAGLDAALEF